MVLADGTLLRTGSKAYSETYPSMGWHYHSNTFPNIKNLFIDAGGTLGVAMVAKAPADGYTLLMSDIASHCISATLYGTKLPYDTLKDFQPIMLVAGSPMVLVANPAPQVRTLRQLIDLAKSRPGQLSYASSGSGAITHLAAVRM